MSERSYTILGTGAIGGFYGARLQRAGAPTHFLAHSDYEHVRARGLMVESNDGDFALPHVLCYNDARQMPRCDVANVVIPPKGTVEGACASPTRAGGFLGAPGPQEWGCALAPRQIKNLSLGQRIDWMRGLAHLP